MIDLTLIPNPPRGVVDAIATEAEAQERRRKAAAEVRSADLALAGARRQIPNAVKDAVAQGKPTPKAARTTVRECEERLEDAKRRSQAAKQLAAEARRHLGHAIHEARDDLAAQIDYTSDAEHLLEKIDALESELAAFAFKCGMLRTIATATDERAQHRGVEPLRTGRDHDRHGKPSKLLANLRGQVSDLRETADKIVKPGGAALADHVGTGEGSARARLAIGTT